MLRFWRSKKAFTLIELMIVVAIIGILAGVAIPRYMNFIRRSREAATKGNLGAVRSALNIYCSDMDGFFPARGVAAGANIPAGTGINGTPFKGTGTNNYIDEIKPATEDCQDKGHAPIAVASIITAQNMGATGAQDGGWVYQTGPVTANTSSVVMRFVVDCGQSDTKGTIISTW